MLKQQHQQQQQESQPHKQQSAYNGPLVARLPVQWASALSYAPRWTERDLQDILDNSQASDSSSGVRNLVDNQRQIYFNLVRTLWSLRPAGWHKTLIFTMLLLIACRQYCLVVHDIYVSHRTVVSECTLHFRLVSICSSDSFLYYPHYVATRSAYQ